MVLKSFYHFTIVDDDPVRPGGRCSALAGVKKGSEQGDMGYNNYGGVPGNR